MVSFYSSDIVSCAMVSLRSQTLVLTLWIPSPFVIVIVVIVAVVGFPGAVPTDYNFIQLGSKDEVLDFIIKFLNMIQLQLKVHVRRIRIDNETEFVTQTLREYYEKVGISHETSVARSPRTRLYEMTPTTISSGLVPNPPPSIPFVPPIRTDFDILFQPLFDELLTPPPSIDPPAPEVISLNVEVVSPVPAASTDSPSSTTIDQDAPSPNNSQTTTET
ncbi:retrovirus-related pol polyprotein from transposon TNT 1-94 [Tanacetum coccineum]